MERWRRLHRTAAEVGDADRRTALELSAVHAPVPPAGRAERPAGVGLRRGDSGAAVRALQGRLLAGGVDPGPVDGRFGPRTEAAVRAFQRAHQLDRTGRADLATTTALLNQRVRTPPTPTAATAGCRPVS